MYISALGVCSAWLLAALEFKRRKKGRGYCPKFYMNVKIRYYCFCCCCWFAYVCGWLPCQYLLDILYRVSSILIFSGITHNDHTTIFFIIYMYVHNQCTVSRLVTSFVQNITILYQFQDIIFTLILESSWVYTYL